MAAVLFFVVLAAGCAFQVQAEVNLLSNPGVEEGEDQPPGWWSGSWGDGGAWFWKGNGTARSGSNSLAIGLGLENETLGGTGYWGQTLTQVLPGEQWEFSAWTKTETGFQGRVWLAVEFKDSQGAFLLTNQSDEVSGAHTKYARLAMQTQPAPPGTAEVTFQIRAGGNRFSVVIDDVVVSCLNHPDARLGLPVASKEFAAWKDQSAGRIPARWRTSKLPHGGWSMLLPDGTPFLPVGIDYEPLSLYTPLDWTKIGRDMDLIRDAGFNTLAIWCVNFHNRQEGRKRLSHEEMGTMAEMASARGLFVQFHLALDRFTHLFPRATLPNGQLHHFDIDYADLEYREFCRNYARRMAMTLQAHDNVTMIIPWEEKIGLSADLDRANPRVFALYASEAGKKGFVSWLQQRHGSLGQLNARWGTKYKSFQQAVDESLREYQQGVSKDDHRQFDILEYGQIFLMDFTQSFVEAYKEVDASMLFQCRHFDLFGPERALHPGLSFLDTFGINNYSLGHRGPDLSFREEFIKTKLVAGIAGIAPYVGNFGFRAEAQDKGTHGRVDSEGMKAHFGADSLIAYSFIPELSGLSYYMYLYAGWEGPWGIVRGDARERTPIYNAFKAANELLAKKNERVASTDYASNAPLSIFHGLDAIFDLAPSGWIEHPALSFDLTEMNVNYEVITDSPAFDPAAHPVILAFFHAYDRRLDAAVVGGLADYCRRGGTLVIGNAFAQADRYGWKNPTSEALVRKLRGVDIGGLKRGTVQVEGSSLPPVTLEDVFYVEAKTETLDHNAEILLSMKVGGVEHPALIRRAHGKGMVYYFCFNPLGQKNLWEAELESKSRTSLPILSYLCHQLGIPADDRLGNRGFTLMDGRLNIHEKPVHFFPNREMAAAGLYEDEYGETEEAYSGGVFAGDFLSFRGRHFEEQGWRVEMPAVTSLGACVASNTLSFYTLDAAELRLKKGPWDIQMQTEPFHVYHQPEPAAAGN